MRIKVSHGFVLLEILPALMLLLGALAISGRLLAHTVETRDRSHRMLLIQDGIMPVWMAWQVRGGFAALASLDENGTWMIRTFPDSSWLPMDPESARARQFLFRRIPSLNPDSWKISLFMKDGSGVGRWIELTRILNLEELPEE
ncbi:hypothetical protein G0Q06_13595 [Puniceicoccales bacterium CK1056]|uniref:Uncharacterized protein n=1 Tax=Oceanipulchritudo coccoides TaxID=2706888 RepID=A0A6B2M411_9BACT|nr:hypothetical protein [Oceanipulchritudo coccoides]NDV63493.1 hypothetical protein [Oceanipulchritudo coccoides]